MKEQHPTLARPCRIASLFGLLAVLLLAAPAAPAAEPVSLEMPIHCTPGEDCWVVNYVDLDPSPAIADYTCGRATYDGHKGTDIAIIDAARMRDGVPVYASAAGIVRGARNDMADIDFTRNGGPESVAGKECGNGVLIDHGEGWKTQYCHMMKGSVLARSGDKVASGRQIGLVGMSGLSQFPHIHVQVSHNGKFIDPFVGETPDNDCASGDNPLWNDQAIKAMPYRPTAIYNAGFASTTPNMYFAREGKYADEVLLDTSPVIAMWADIFMVKANDKITYLITGPDGKSIFGHTLTLKKSEGRRFTYAGIRRKNEAWPTGTYTGQISLVRPATGEEFSVVREINVI